jgi:hypothetical protein|tara:strand:+ start:445 stop:762 length:318 start_codon:yes stop_codon:yes gene_type:complete
MKDNKLIAEFMGEKFTDNSGVVQGLNYKLIEKKHGKGNNGFRFHTSWDWLKPVVDKIEMECGGVPYQLLDCNLYSDIGEVYQAVVEFLKDHACHIELQEWEKNNQ